MTEEEDLKIIQIHHKFSEICSKVSCLPPEEWEQYIDFLCNDLLDDPLITESMSDFVESQSEPMHAKNLRLSLSVDPERRDESGLACVVGAIRLRELGERVLGSDLAETYLSSRLVKELSEDTSGIAVAIGPLATESVGKNPLYEVWLAIAHLMNDSADTLAPSNSTLAEQEISSMIFLSKLPSSTQVRKLTQSNPDFPALQHLEQGRWTDVWNESGARDFVRMDKGGRPRKDS